MQERIDAHALTADPRLRADAVRRAWEAAAAEPHGGITAVAEADAIDRELDRVREMRGALAGLPVVVKDNVHVAGLPTTAGTPALRGYVPATDADSVARLRAHGMVVIGKANMHELALGVTSTHTATGAVQNPVLSGRVVGGSSGGTAAAVAAGVCTNGLGSDTGGSTRIPAAFTDTWGFRPSTGRYPGTGTVTISYSRDTVGPMAADLASLRLLDAVLAGGDVARASAADSEPLRLGIDPSDAERCDTAVGAAFHAALDRVRSSTGLELVELSLDALDRSVAEFEPRLGAQELVASLDRYLCSDDRLPSLDRVVDELVDPHVAAMIEGGRAAVADGVWSETWHRLLVDCARARSSYIALARRNRLDAVLRPTVPRLPPFVEEVVALDLPGRDRLFGTITEFTRLATVVGSPSISLPLGALIGHHGTGLLLDGIPGCDEELLSIAASVEAALRGPAAAA